MRIVYLILYMILLFEPLTMSSVSANSTIKNTLTQIVSQSVCDKQVVVLGELPTHGEALGFQAKADMVQYLTQHCNFTALYFEAPIYDFIGFQQALTEEKAQPEQLNQAIGGFWNTQELTTWRQWLFDQATVGKISLAGLDDQVSVTSVFAKTTLPYLLGSNVAAKNQTECQQTIERNMYWRYDEDHPYGQVERALLQQCTQQAAEQLKTTSNTNLSEKKMAENFANLHTRNNKNAMAFSRDEAMYRNFQWQYQGLPKDSKVIIWTATVHAARQQGELKRKPMGVWLAEQWHDNMAVIGFTAYSGESSMAGNPIKPMAIAPPDSLEAWVTKLDSDWAFLDATKLSEIGTVSSRLYGRFTTADWSAKFDGVVIFRQEQAPTFKK